MCKFIPETQKLLTADLKMFQTKQKPHQTLQLIGAETVMRISMQTASQKQVGELILIGTVQYKLGYMY